MTRRCAVGMVIASHAPVVSMIATLAIASTAMLKIQTKPVQSVQAATLKHRRANAFIARGRRTRAMTMVSVFYRTRPGATSMKPFVIVKNRGSGKIARNACCAMAMDSVATHQAVSHAFVTRYGLECTVQHA